MVSFKFTAIIAIMATAVIASPAPVETIDKDHYLAEYASLETTRLTNYRAGHTLTPEQDAIIDKLLVIVGTADAPAMDALRGDVEAQFGVEEARALLIPDAPQGNVTPRSGIESLLGRQPRCECTNGWGCSGGARCPVNSGCFRHKGCGALWLYVCNGICVM